LAADAGDGDVNVNYTINFADLTTETGTILISDWFCSGCVSYGIKDLGRADLTSGNMDAATSFTIYEYPINIALGDQLKQINSIDFTVPGTEGGVANIFAVTGTASTSALPVSLE